MEELDDDWREYLSGIIAEDESDGDYKKHPFFYEL